MKTSYFCLVVSLFVVGCSAGPSSQDEVFFSTSDDTTADEVRATDNVEIKATIDASDIAFARNRLNLRSSSATERDVYFYDTRSLSLYQQGIILRSRKVYDGPDDSTIKLRPLSRRDVSNSWLSLSGFKCETDWVGSNAVDSCSFTTTQDRGEIDSVAEGSRRIDQLYSSDQEDYVDQYGEITVPWSSLVVMGPVPTQVWKVRTRTFPQGLTAELWYLPSGQQLLEISTRVPRSQATQTANQFYRYLADLGIDVSDTQETKTRLVLDYYRRQR